MTQRKSTTWLGYAGWGVLGAMLLASCGRSNLDWAELYGQGGFGGSSSTTTTSSGPSTTTSSGPSTTTSSGPTTTTTTTGTTECSSPVECDDGDFCTTDDCVGGLCNYVLRDDDSDDHVATACGGDDCNDLNPNTFPGHPEVCTDADDNDCNGVADCFDPACFNAPTCGCQPSPGGEDCDNGQDDDCDTTVDCNDTNCIGTPACGCAPSEAGACDNGFDDDCDGNIDCDDNECFGAANCQCQSQNEDCSNDQDDDCDLLIDCADADCAGTFPCKCQPPGSAEVCGSGLDEDCDTLIDCADPECLVTPGCQNCTQELCTDGVDNNCDNQIDCADPACFFDPACSPTQEVCNNQLDDDNDGKIDCSDPDCANNPLCVLQQKNCLSPKLIPGTGTYTGDTTGNVSETKGFCGGDAGEAVFYFVLTDPSFVQLNSVGTSFDSTLYVRTGKCNSGKEIGCDDDSGGSWAASLTFSILYPGTYYVFLDGYTIDPQGGANEGPFVLNATIIPNPPEICGDGIENDGDHYVDCADSDCVAAPGCSCNAPVLSGPEFGAGACTDGIDNDCDGTFDCGDDDCSASDYYVTECCDGTDENGNGIPDDFNCRCASDLDCDAGTICYTHTAYACGIPCDSFFGDVCPFVAAGSYCNATTHQCEF